MNTVTVNLPSAIIARLLAAVAQLKGPKFVGVTYRAEGTGELARHVVIVGADYKECTRKSMEEVTRLLPTLCGLQAEAANELIESYSKTLLAVDTNTPHPDNTNAETFVNIVPGLRVHKETGAFQLCGLSHSKKVLEEGVYKTVNSKPLTLAKRAIEKDLPRGKYRAFSLKVDALQSIRIGGAEIDVVE